MNELEKLTFMYEEVEGKITNTTSAYVSAEYVEMYPDQGEVPVIQCEKDGHICWTMSKEDVLFNYITRDM